MSRSLAHGKAVADRRSRGERVGLLVAALHDWRSGTWYDGRGEVARVVLPSDLAVDDADWAVASGVDVLVCGPAPDPVFYAACSALDAAGAASIWGEFASGICRMEHSQRYWGSIEGPYSPTVFPKALHKHRRWSIIKGDGFYGRPVFAAARRAILESNPFLVQILVDLDKDDLPPEVIADEMMMSIRSAATMKVAA